MSEKNKKTTPKKDEFDEEGIKAKVIIDEETNGKPYDVRDILEMFKNAVCLKCGAKGKAEYIVTEDDGYGRKAGYMICLECGANMWNPKTVDRSGVLEEEY